MFSARSTALYSIMFASLCFLALALTAHGCEIDRFEIKSDSETTQYEAPNCQCDATDSLDEYTPQNQTKTKKITDDHSDLDATTPSPIVVVVAHGLVVGSTYSITGPPGKTPLWPVGLARAHL